MKLNFTQDLLEADIHLPELVVKGRSLIRILEEYNSYLNENKIKMKNKKVIKEAVSPEQKQELMSRTVSVEKSVLNLYEYVVTDIQDESLISLVSKLKSHIADFTQLVEKKEDEGTLGDEDIENSKIDLNSPPKERSVIESVEKEEEEKETISESKNKKLSLKEEKTWKGTVSLNKEFKFFIESYSINGFKSKTTKSAILKLTESLQKKVNLIKENYSLSEANLFEEAIEDIKTAETEQEFEECYNRMTEWANKDKKLFIKYK